MQRVRLLPVVWFLGCVLLFALYGCGGGGSDSEDGSAVQETASGDNVSEETTEEQTANAAFNGTFGGTFTAVQGGQTFNQAVAVTLTVGSPLNGTFVSDTGADGTIWGEAVGDSGTFTGDFGGNGCGGVLKGSLTLVDADTISWEATGTDCNGAFTDTGTLTRIDALSDAGVWQGQWSSGGYRGGITAILGNEAGPSVTGTITITGSSCFTDGAINGDINPQVILSASFGGGQSVRLTGELILGRFAMDGMFEVSDGLCDGDVGSWRLIKISD